MYCFTAARTWESARHEFTGGAENGHSKVTMKIALYWGTLLEVSIRKKTRKAGRPPLPKGAAKAVMLRVRITTDERKAIAKAASIGQKSLSEWIRGTLNAALQG